MTDTHHPLTMIRGLFQIFRSLAVGGALGLLASLSLRAQELPLDTAPFIEEAVTEEELVAGIRRHWELEGIESAIRTGYFSVAETLVRRLLEKDLEKEQASVLLNYHLHIALVKGNLSAANRIHERILSEGFQAKPLLAALLNYFNGNPAKARETLEAVDNAQLTPSDRAWVRLIEALLLQREGSVEAANQAFLRAERTAPTALLRDHFEIIRLREDLRNGVFGEENISALRESVRSMRGERGGFEAARLLAVALNRSGNQTEAIEILNQHLALPGLREFGLRSDFLLLIGYIAGPESLRGQLALRQLLSEASGENSDLSVALSLLAQSFPDAISRETFLADINNWLQAEPPHPLTDRLLAYKAYLLVLGNALSEAEESALRILEAFPNSTYVNTALRQLAYISWSQSPPRYRTAADYLNQLRLRLPMGPQALETGVLIADCYFLNEDYTSASDAYSAVLNDAPADLAKNVFFQRILSELGADRPDLAARYIDAAYADPRLGLATIWRAEWNLLDYFRRNGRTEEAFARISLILSRGTLNDPVPAALRLRMEWIAARLTLESGRPQEAERRANDLLASLAGSRYQQLDPELRQDVESHLLLLIGESRVAMGNKASALESFTLLRERFPLSGPSILSYLVESRAESDEDNLVSAQQSLINLVDRFPQSEYAPIALWEAALNAEQRGLVIHLQEAISILERLVTDYPNHNLVYFARLKQGDLARRLNDFPTALLLYERLLAEYPDHPQRFRAEMSRADCLMALGSEDETRLDLAAAVYERVCLLSSAPVPIRMEAGFKWAHSLRQQGDVRGSEGVLWLLFERFVLDANVSQPVLAEDAGRYWMARTLLELGNLQLDQGETAAAIRVFELVPRLNLPGAAIARSRLETIR